MSLETFDWKGYLQYIGYPEDQIPDTISNEELLDIRRHWAQTVYQEELAAAQDDPFLETPKERREHARDVLLAAAPEFRSEFGLRDPQPAEKAFSAQEFHDWVVNNEYQDGNLDFYLKTFAASRINKNTKYEYPYLEGLTKKEFQDMFMEQNGIDPDLTTIEDIRNGNFGPVAMAQRAEEESNLPKGSAMRQGWLEFKKLTGLTTETFGDFLGVEWMRNIGRGITENAIKTIDEEGYRGKYQESLVDTIKNEGIFAGAGKVLQMAQENWATTGVPLALAGMSAMFGIASRNPRLAAQSLASARASLAAATSADVAMGTGAAATVGRVGASTIAKSLAFASAMASGLEVGAVREELEQKGKEEGRQLYDPNDPGDAVAWGLLSAALDHVGNMGTFIGGGGLIRAAKGLVQSQQTRMLEAASAAARQATREAGKSWGRKIVEAMGIEGVTESLQELPAIMAARNKGVEYTPKEIRDRMIDAGVVGAFMGGGVRSVQSIPETLRERARRTQSESETTQTPATPPAPPTNVPPAPNQPPPPGFDEKLAWNTNFAEIDNGNGWAAWDGYNVGYGKTKEEASQALLDQSNANKDQISGTPTSTANESRISFGNGGELIVTGNGHQGVIKRIIDLHNSNDNYISLDGTRTHTFDATVLSGLNEKDFRKHISENWGNTTLPNIRSVRQARVDQVDIGINFDAEIRDNNGNIIGHRAELDLNSYRDQLEAKGYRIIGSRFFNNGNTQTVQLFRDGQLYTINLTTNGNEVTSTVSTKGILGNFDGRVESEFSTQRHRITDVGGAARVVNNVLSVAPAIRAGGVQIERDAAGADAKFVNRKALEDFVKKQGGKIDKIGERSITYEFGGETMKLDLQANGDVLVSRNGRFLGSYQFDGSDVGNGVQRATYDLVNNVTSSPRFSERDVWQEMGYARKVGGRRNVLIVYDNERNEYYVIKVSKNGSVTTAMIPRDPNGFFARLEALQNMRTIEDVRFVYGSQFRIGYVEMVTDANGVYGMRSRTTGLVTDNINDVQFFTDDEIDDIINNSANPSYNPDFMRNVVKVIGISQYTSNTTTTPARIVDWVTVDDPSQVAGFIERAKGYGAIIADYDSMGSNISELGKAWNAPGEITADAGGLGLTDLYEGNYLNFEPDAYIDDLVRQGNASARLSIEEDIKKVAKATRKAFQDMRDLLSRSSAYLPSITTYDIQALENSYRSVFARRPKNIVNTAIKAKDIRRHFYRARLLQAKLHVEVLASDPEFYGNRIIDDTIRNTAYDPNWDNDELRFAAAEAEEFVLRLEEEFLSLRDMQKNTSITRQIWDALYPGQGGMYGSFVERIHDQGRDFRFSRDVNATRAERNISILDELSRHPFLGQGALNDLIESGKLVILSTQQEIESALIRERGYAPHFSELGNIQGFASNDNQRIYLSEWGIKQGDAFSVLLHEFGVHAKYLGFTQAQFQEILAGIRQNATAQTPEGRWIRLAIQKVESTNMKRNNPYFWEEVAAYLVEHSNEYAGLGILDRMQAWVKRWLFTNGYIDATNFHYQDFAIFSLGMLKDSRIPFRLMNGKFDYSKHQAGIYDARKFVEDYITDDLVNELGYSREELRELMAAHLVGTYKNIHVLGDLPDEEEFSSHFPGMDAAWAEYRRDRSLDDSQFSRDIETALNERINTDFIRYSRINVEGARRLDISDPRGLTTRMMEYDLAVQMEAEGRSEAEIKALTNWTRGNDGLWGYEVVDKDMTFEIPGIAALEEELNTLQVPQEEFERQYRKYLEDQVREKYFPGSGENFSAKYLLSGFDSRLSDYRIVKNLSPSERVKINQMYKKGVGYPLIYSGIRSDFPAVLQFKRILLRDILERMGEVGRTYTNWVNGEESQIGEKRRGDENFTSSYKADSQTRREFDNLISILEDESLGGLTEEQHVARIEQEVQRIKAALSERIRLQSRDNYKIFSDLATGKLKEELDRFVNSKAKQIESLKERISSLKKGHQGKLSNVVLHPELFHAYPELEDVQLEFKVMFPGIGGYMEETTREGASKRHFRIVINSLLNTEQMKSTALHEMQHVIQVLSGFASGGNTAMFRDADLLRRTRYLKLQGRIEDLQMKRALSKIVTRENVLDFVTSDLYQNELVIDGKFARFSDEFYIRGQAVNGIGQFVDVLLNGQFAPSLSDHLGGTFYNYLKETHPELLKDVERDYNEAQQRKLKADNEYRELTDEPFQKYRRLMGELEARVTQRRMNMTEEEMRETPISETEREFEGIEKEELIDPRDLKEVVNGEPGIEPELRYSLIGEIGVAALDAYEEGTTRLDNLAVAREMEAAGKDAKAVKLATGWERGKDGKWRYEIDDSGNTLNLKAAQKGEITLVDVLDAPELFRAYPQLGDVRVKLEFDEYHELGEATYYKDDNLIILGGNSDDDNAILRSALHHEIQHAIQEIEGFAPGGNILTFDSLQVQKIIEAKGKALDERRGDVVKFLKNVLNDSVLRDFLATQGVSTDEDGNLSANSRFGELFLGESRRRPNSLGAYRFQFVRDLYYPADTLREQLGKALYDFMAGHGTYGDKLQTLSKEYEGLVRELNKARREYDRYTEGSAYQRYQRLAGETESRNVEHRLDMTLEQRRASLAEETEDVAREDQIILENMLNEASSAVRYSRTTTEEEADAILNNQAENGLYGDIRYSRVTDSDEIDRYEAELREGRVPQPLYRAMVRWGGGSLHSPMAEIIAGQTVSLYEGDWERADEFPNLLIKTGKDKGKFPLKKVGGGTVLAAYAPFIHSSLFPLNDQFYIAYKRPLVIVQMGVPASELNVPKDELSESTQELSEKRPGMTTWRAGTVSSKLGGRNVMLSRYGKIERILQDSEVAKIIADKIREVDKDIAVPINVVHKGLLRELVREGIKIGDVVGRINSEDHIMLTSALADIQENGVNAAYFKDILPSPPRFSIAQQSIPVEQEMPLPEGTIRFSHRDVAKLTYDFGNFKDISLQQFSERFQKYIEGRDKTIEDVERICADYIENVSNKPADFVPQLDPRKRNYLRYFFIENGESRGQLYDDTNAQHNYDASDQQLQVIALYRQSLSEEDFNRLYKLLSIPRNEQTKEQKDEIASLDSRAKESGNLGRSAQEEADTINRERNKAIRDLAQYFKGNSDYHSTEKALILWGAMRYAITERMVNNDELEVKLWKLSDDNDARVMVVGGELTAKIVDHLRRGASYEDALIKASKEMKEINAAKRGVPVGFTGWKVYEQNDSYEAGQELQQAVAGTGWCTGASVSTAQIHRTGGDFHVYFENGNPTIAIRTENGRMAEPPRGAHEGQFCTPEEEAIAEEYIRIGGKIAAGDDYLKDREDIRRVASGEMTWQEAFMIPTQRRYKNGFGNDSKEWPEGVKREIAKILDEHKEERKAVGWYYLEEVLANKNIENEVVIVNMRERKDGLTGNFPKLTTIIGDATIYNFANIPNLETISGNVYIDITTDIPALTTVGGKVFIDIFGRFTPTDINTFREIQRQRQRQNGVRYSLRSTQPTTVEQGTAIPNAPGMYKMRDGSIQVHPEEVPPGRETEMAIYAAVVLSEPAKNDPGIVDLREMIAADEVLREQVLAELSARGIEDNPDNEFVFGIRNVLQTREPENPTYQAIVDVFHDVITKATGGVQDEILLTDNDIAAAAYAITNTPFEPLLGEPVPTAPTPKETVFDKIEREYRMIEDRHREIVENLIEVDENTGGVRFSIAGCDVFLDGNFRDTTTDRNKQEFYAELERIHGTTHQYGEADGFYNQLASAQITGTQEVRDYGALAQPADANRALVEDFIRRLNPEIYDKIQIEWVNTPDANTNLAGGLASFNPVGRAAGKLIYIQGWGRTAGQVIRSAAWEASRFGWNSGIISNLKAPLTRFYDLHESVIYQELSPYYTKYGITRGNVGDEHKVFLVQSYFAKMNQDILTGNQNALANAIGIDPATYKKIHDEVQNNVNAAARDITDYIERSGSISTDPEIARAFAQDILRIVMGGMNGRGASFVYKTNGSGVSDTIYCYTNDFGLHRKPRLPADDENRHAHVAREIKENIKWWRRTFAPFGLGELAANFCKFFLRNFPMHNGLSFLHLNVPHARLGDSTITRATNIISRIWQRIDDPHGIEIRRNIAVMEKVQAILRDHHYDARWTQNATGGYEALFRSLGITDEKSLATARLADHALPGMLAMIRKNAEAIRTEFANTVDSLVSYMESGGVPLHEINRAVERMNAYAESFIDDYEHRSYEVYTTDGLDELIAMEHDINIDPTTGEMGIYAKAQQARKFIADTEARLRSRNAEFYKQTEEARKIVRRLERIESLRKYKEGKLRQAKSPLSGAELQEAVIKQMNDEIAARIKDIQDLKVEGRGSYKKFNYIPGSKRRKLDERLELDREYMNFLGRIEDPLMNAIYSIDQQRKIIEKLYFNRQLGEHILSTGMGTISGGVVSTPVGAGTVGDLTNMENGSFLQYVNVDPLFLKEINNEYILNSNVRDSVIGGVIDVWKANNTIYSIKLGINNYVGNFSMLLASGHLWRYANWINAGQITKRQFLERYTDNLEDMNQFAEQVYEEMRDNRVVGGTMSEMNVMTYGRGHHEKIFSMLVRHLRDANILSNQGTFRAEEWVNNFLEKMKLTYAFGDEWVKPLMYLNNRANAIAKYESKLNPNDPRFAGDIKSWRDEVKRLAIQEAAEQTIRESVSWENSPQFIRALSQQNLRIFTPDFLMHNFQMVRITASNFMRWAECIKELSTLEVNNERDAKYQDALIKEIAQRSIGGAMTTATYAMLMGATGSVMALVPYMFNVLFKSIEGEDGDDEKKGMFFDPQEWEGAQRLMNYKTGGNNLFVPVFRKDNKIYAWNYVRSSVMLTHAPVMPPTENPDFIDRGVVVFKNLVDLSNGTMTQQLINNMMGRDRWGREIGTLAGWGQVIERTMVPGFVRQLAGVTLGYPLTDNLYHQGRLIKVPDLLGITVNEYDPRDIANQLAFDITAHNNNGKNVARRNFMDRLLKSDVLDDRQLVDMISDMRAKNAGELDKANYVLTGLRQVGMTDKELMQWLTVSRKSGGDALGRNQAADFLKGKNVYDRTLLTSLINKRKDLIEEGKKTRMSKEELAIVVGNLDRAIRIYSQAIRTQ